MRDCKHGLGLHGGFENSLPAAFYSAHSSLSTIVLLYYYYALFRGRRCFLMIGSVILGLNEAYYCIIVLYTITCKHLWLYTDRLCDASSLWRHSDCRTNCCRGSPFSRGPPNFMTGSKFIFTWTWGPVVPIIGGPYIYLTPGSNIAVRSQWAMIAWVRAASRFQC